MVKQPNLLISPTLPPSLVKFSPREVLGSVWWETARKEASEKSNNTCHVCGIAKERTKKKYLEGHEIYEIQDDIIVFKEVVSLCSYCHSFIHLGNLLVKHRQGIVSRQYVTYILNHGINILSDSGLKPLSHQAIAWLMLCKGYDQEQALQYIVKKELYAEKMEINKILIKGKLYG